MRERSASPKEASPPETPEAASASPATAPEGGTHEVTLPEGPAMRLDKALARALGPALSRSRLRGLIEAGQVRPLTQEGAAPVTDPAFRAGGGTRWRITVPPVRESVLVPEDIPLEIVHEDDALIVIDKPAGMVVHPAPGAATGTLVHALLHHCGDSLSGVGGVARPGIVHRLDKDTSGLIVVAKTDAAHRALAAQFADRTAGRRYLALLHGVPERGDPRLAGLPGVAFEPGGVIRIAADIGRHPKDRQRMAVLRGGGRPAVTRMKVEERFGAAAALVRCKLDTGRTHQIRVHAAHVGHPVIGDPVYGRRRFPGTLGDAARTAAETFPRQALHAAELAFRHPASGAMMTFHAPLPADMARLLAVLRAGRDATSPNEG